MSPGTAHQTQLHVIRPTEKPGEPIYPIRNARTVKPNGGLWTSTYDPERGSAWVQWCLSEEFDIPTDGVWQGRILTPRRDARIAVIDSLDDLERLYRRYPLEVISGLWSVLDFERMAADYDAVHLTDDGQWATRLTHPYSLYGWDCESTNWFRWAFAESYRTENRWNLVPYRDPVEA